MLELEHDSEQGEFIWDRRSAGRRSRSEPVVTDRRRGDRRRPLPVSWFMHDFVRVLAGNDPENPS